MSHKAISCFLILFAAPFFLGCSVGHSDATTVTFTPTPTPAPTPVLAMGGTSVCGVTTSNATYCWGNNSSGALGNSTNAGTTTANSTPLAAAAGLTLTKITVGSTAGCGLTSAGTAYCWGTNLYGQLGSTTNLGTATLSTAPLAVASAKSFSALSTSGSHSCGLTTDQKIYCWGLNSSGELGNSANSGTTSSNSTPLQVTGGAQFTQVTTGLAHSCGLQSGNAYCWGSNTYGQLGFATNVGTSLDNSSATLVGGGHRFLVLQAGDRHTCGLTTDYDIYCWGQNLYGALGTSTSCGTATPVTTPQIVNLGVTKYSALAAGGTHTCGVQSSGAISCWGSNLDSQLGNSTNAGTSTANCTPLAVSAGSTTFSYVFAGTTSTCATTSSHDLYCWGSNTYGQLGNGGSTSTTPTLVSGYAF